jgi:hypothetical protein
VYHVFQERDIPVTVHCQEDSFELTENHKQAVSFTSADNWIQVFGQQPPAPDLSGLRINFGHFGGEKGLSSTIFWEPEGGFDITAGGDTEPVYTADSLIGKSGWTYKIISLLKKHPHTYADISAYDFADPVNAALFLWVLAFDGKGKFDMPGAPNHKLEDKLLWGSDYPMILAGKKYPNYRTYFASFLDVINNKIKGLENHKTPGAGKLPAPDTLLRKLVWHNPKKFLFAGE